jgi:hypothetical protein
MSLAGVNAVVLNQWAASLRANRRFVAGCPAEKVGGAGGSAGDGVLARLRAGQQLAAAVHGAARNEQSDGSPFSLAVPVPDIALDGADAETRADAKAQWEKYEVGAAPPPPPPPPPLPDSAACIPVSYHLAYHHHLTHTHTPPPCLPQADYASAPRYKERARLNPMVYGAPHMKSG